MEALSKGRRLGKRPIPSGKQADSTGKPETGVEHHGANPPSTPVPQAQAAPAAAPPVAVVPANATPFEDDSDAAGTGLSRAQRWEALERHLRRPYPHATEFYLVDLIDRMGQTVPFVERQDLLAQAAQPGQICQMTLGEVLDAALRAGALEWVDGPAGAGGGAVDMEADPVGGYRITALGKRHLEQAKAIRVALWHINPGLSIAEICAIVQIEGSDPLFDLIYLHPSNVQAREERIAGSRPPKGEARRRAKASAGPGVVKPTAPTTPPGPTAGRISALWAGLLAPTRQNSYSDGNGP